VGPAASSAAKIKREDAKIEREDAKIMQKDAKIMQKCAKTSRQDEQDAIESKTLARLLLQKSSGRCTAY